MKNGNIEVLGISGSLRAASFNSALLRAAGHLMPEDMSLVVAEIGDLPHYSADTERAGFPEPVLRLRAQVAAADALLIATPEFNGSIPGVLKNAYDWASRAPNPPISLKPTAVMGAGGRLGTSRAQQHLRDIAVSHDLKMVQQPQVLVTEAWEKFDRAGNLVDERTRDQVTRLLLALRSLTLRIRATRRRVLAMDVPGPANRDAMKRLREVGYEPVAVFDEDKALELLNPGAFAALVVAPEVPEAVRATLRHHVEELAPNTVIAEGVAPPDVVRVLEELL
jgi:chromate reductase